MQKKELIKETKEDLDARVWACHEHNACGYSWGCPLPSEHGEYHWLIRD